MTARAPGRRWGPFVALELATLLSATGNGIAMIALPWLVLELTGKASDAALVAAAGALPLLATALFAGTVVDRVGRRRTAVVSEALSAVSVAAIPVVGRARQPDADVVDGARRPRRVLRPGGRDRTPDDAAGRLRPGGATPRAGERHPRGALQHGLPRRARASAGCSSPSSAPRRPCGPPRPRSSRPA